MTRSAWRKRRTLKWIGLLLSIMMLGLWVFSVNFALIYVPPSGQWSFSILAGYVGFGDGQQFVPEWICFRSSSGLMRLAAEMPWTEFAHDFLGLGLPGLVVNGVVHVPIWLFVVTVGFPTAVLWWRDRRPKAGFCKVCKYDLTGNVSGVCPECGTAVVKPKT